HASEPRIASARTQAPPARASASFNFLHDADPESLVPYLHNEHPQTIAVVASHMPQEHAARFLTALPASIQADVIRRLADLDEMDPESLRELERGLESWMSE